MTHGQQGREEAERFAKLASGISVQATPVLWEPLFVPWWFVIAAMFATRSIQYASIRGTRRQPNKRTGETAGKTDVDGAQLLAWMT